MCILFKKQFRKTQILLEKELSNNEDMNVNLKSTEVSIITY